MQILNEGIIKSGTLLLGGVIATNAVYFVTVKYKAMKSHAQKVVIKLWHVHDIIRILLESN